MSGRDDHGASVDDAAVRGLYDWSSTSPSQAVVETVAAAVGDSQAEIDPLYEYVDPDGLNALVRSDVEPCDEVVVSFVMADYEVDVHGDGRVIVRSPDTA